MFFLVFANPPGYALAWACSNAPKVKVRAGLYLHIAVLHDMPVLIAHRDNARREHLHQRAAGQGVLLRVHVRPVLVVLKQELHTRHVIGLRQ